MLRTEQLVSHLHGQPLQESNLATGGIVQSAWSSVACTFKGVRRSLIKWDCVCERTLGASLLGSHIKTLLLSHLIYPQKSSSSAPILSREPEMPQVESSLKLLFNERLKVIFFLSFFFFTNKSNVFLRDCLVFWVRVA